MTAPAYTHTIDLGLRLAFQCAVNRVLLATTRPKGRGGPMLSTAEMAVMERAYEQGISPEAFAAVVVALDKKAARRDGGGA